MTMNSDHVPARKLTIGRPRSSSKWLFITALGLAVSVQSKPLFAQQNQSGISADEQAAQWVNQSGQQLSPKAQELKVKIAQVLAEMTRLMEQTEAETVDPAVILRLRQLNARYEQLSLEFEMHHGEIELGDLEAEAAKEAGLAPGLVTVQELQELTQR